jgi:hypothetical protein
LKNGSQLGGVWFKQSFAPFYLSTVTASNGFCGLAQAMATIKIGEKLGAASLQRVLFVVTPETGLR